MILNEATATMRTIKARLFDAAGNPLALNHVFNAGDLKIVQPDGTVANATNLPLAIATAVPGTFDIVIATAELQQRGQIRVQLSAAGVQYWEWIEIVDYSPLMTNDARLDNIDARISTRATPGSAMALTPGEELAIVSALLDAALSGHALAGSVGIALQQAAQAGNNTLSARAILDSVIEGPDQYDGNGEATPIGHQAGEYDVTVAGALRELLAFCAAAASGLTLQNGQGAPVFKSRVGGRNRLVMVLANGNRSIVSRDDT